MKERPILFTTPMMKAILEGTKTVTRRMVDINPELGKDITKWGFSIFTPDGCISARTKQPTERGHRYGEKWIKLKYGKKGDTLWVRETWRPFLKGSDTPPGYWNMFEFKAGGDKLAPLEYELKFDEFIINGKWHPSIHMPKVACRQRLEIMSIRVERLHDITEEDAIKEGLSIISKDQGRTYKYGIPDMDGLPGTDNIGWPWTDWNVSAREAFFTLWRKINGDESFQANPWVWRIEFKKIQHGF